ncbi:MAG: patatin-like phospholipase family protein [Gammaproteobacteria bacterium]
MSVRGPIFILSIDGGGSRGAIPAHVLRQVEQDAGIPIRRTFDFFAGVSTGALIASYCAAEHGSVEALARSSYSSSTMSHVFDKSLWDRLLGRVQNQPKYDGVNKRRYLEGLSPGLRINDITDKHLLVLAYDFINRELVTFKNNRGHDAAYNPLLAEVCDAATAAPTLFPPVPSSGAQRRWLVDGALATNDPSMCAIGEALSLGHVLSDIWMLSLGTGRPTRDLSQSEQDRIGRDALGWGVLGWVTNGLIEHMMGASSTVSAHQCAQLLGERYVRITGELPRKQMQLDNTTDDRVADFEAHAARWYGDHKPRIRELVDRVTMARRAWAAQTAQLDSGIY